MNRKWKIATFMGFLTLAGAFYVWGIPAVVNIEARKPFLEQTIYENSGYRVDIGKPKLKMGWFPSVWISSDNISILNSDNSKALSIDNPRLKLKLFPLLRKKIEISKLSATKEDVYFVFTKDSQFHLGEYSLKQKEKKDSKFELAKMDLNLGEYNIYLDDQKNNKQASLSGKYFENGKYIQNKHARFATKGTINIGGKSTDLFANVDVNLPIDRLSEDKFKIYGKLENFDISSISDYVRILSNNKITSLNGIINFTAETKPDKFGHKTINSVIQTTNLSIIGKDNFESIIYPEKLVAKINFDTIENGINFENTTLDSNNLHAIVNGKIFDLGSKSPKYNIEAEVKDTRLENAVAIVPGYEALLPDFNLYKLKQYVFYGNGEGKVKFVGQGNRPNVTGSIKLSDAYLMHPMKGAPANADINLEFIGKSMRLDVFVPAANNQNVTVKGNIKIDGSKYSELEIESTDNVDMESAQEILNPLHEILKFQLGPVPIMKLAGKGSINMRSAGKKVDPHIWGAIKFKDVTASFNDIKHLELKNGSGEVLFNDTQTTFRSYQAFVNGIPIEIKGDCSVLGKLNVYVTAKGQDVKKLLKIINDSPLLIDVQKVIEPFQKPDGIADVFLQIYGTAKNAEEVVFNEDLFSKGTITFHNAKTTLQDTFLPFTGVNGKVNFDQYDSDYDVTGFVRGSKVHVIGTGSNNLIDLKAYSDKFKLSDVFDMLHPDMVLPYKKEIGNLDVSFTAAYKGLAEAGQLDYNKLLVDGKFIPNMSSSNPIKFNGGTFNIKNGFLKTSTLKGLFNNNPCTLSFVAKDLDKEDLNITEADFNFKDFDIASVNAIKNQIKLPKEIAKEIDNIIDLKGVIDITGSIKNNQIIANTNLKDTSFVYKPFGVVVKVLNGNANMRGDTLYLDKINSRVSSMPVFVDGKITNAYTNPNFNLLVSSKLTQVFFDRFFNSKTVYPVKTKGDINFYTRLNGPLDVLRAKSTLNLGENSSIYYMGATIAGAPTGAFNSEGMTTNPVSIVSDVVLYPNKIKLNSLNYNQTITSQNKKKSIQNQVSASGEITMLNNNIVAFKDFKIKTDNPTNARIFNVLFKKPTIKQGVFTSDLTINGTSEAPYILGFLNVKSVDIPLLDATVRDVNIDFNKDFINIDSKGVILTNDILMNAKIVNKPSMPVEVEDVNVQMEQLDLNVISKALDDFDADNTRTNQLKTTAPQVLPPETLIIKNAQINADNILIKKANATDFKSTITLDKNQVVKVDNYSFNIANGTVNGNISYDLKDFKGAGAMQINNADAQIIAENFFDMPGQIYGTVTGEMNIACTGFSSVDCVNTLSGDGNFKVADGRMPKLGSLEYLLKAGNLITGGVTGLSINGIIDLITPLKTGNFKSISGDVHVKNGIAEDINVYSSGEDLNLYMTGSYNLATLVADMEIYGSLSKNFTTLLGKIANSSLNTLFNTIPGININEINPKSTSNINKIPNFDKTNTLRVFKSEIYGDINGSNYVKSFRWIKN